MTIIIWRKEIVEEAKKQLWIGGPMVFASAFEFSLQMVTMMFVGHLDELLLAGAALATSFVNVTGFNVLIGMSSTLDTFCGQSYGAQEYHMVGIHAQRGMLVMLVATIPISLIWANLRPILVVLRQDKIIASEAQLYARYLIPSLSAFALLRCIVKFLLTQNIVFPMVVATGITSFAHVFVCWLLVIKLGLGIKGGAIAIAISYWLNTILLALYVRFSSSCKITWTGLSREALHNIPQFFRLAVPSAFMVCLETWTFELMVLLSGVLPNPKLQTSVLSIWILIASVCSGFIICGMTFFSFWMSHFHALFSMTNCTFLIPSLNTTCIFWMVPFGVSSAGSTRISNELGAGRPKAAYLAVKVCLFIAFTVGVVESAILFLIRKIWGRAFTNVDQVVRYVALLMPILAANAFLDSFQTAFQGVARGSGWQKLGAFINLGSFYLVGVPSAIVLAFVLHMQGKGLLLGLLFALTLQVLVFLPVTLRSNWEKEAEKAATRVRGNGGQVNNATHGDQNDSTV